MKKLIALLLALVMVFALCACGQQAAPAPAAEKPAEAPAAEAPAAEAPAAEEAAEGKVFNIYAWNEEFKGFFEK